MVRASDSHSRQLLDMEKTSRNQVKKESKAHLDEFESRVTARQDGLISLFEDTSDQM